MNDTSADMSLSLLSKYTRWWPALIGPVAMLALIFIAGRIDTSKVKYYTEIVSPAILGVAALLFALRAWRTGNRFCMILTGLGVAFTCREIHFAGTDIGVKIALVVLIIWSIHWRKRIRGALADVSHVRWVAASAIAYTLCMLVQKRVFKETRLAIIPNEDALHIPLEEALELVAHLLLLLSAFMGSWKVQGSRVAPNSPPPESAAK